LDCREDVRGIARQVVTEAIAIPVVVLGMVGGEGIRAIEFPGPVLIGVGPAIAIEVGTTQPVHAGGASGQRAVIRIGCILDVFTDTEGGMRAIPSAIRPVVAVAVAVLIGPLGIILPEMVRVVFDRPNRSPLAPFIGVGPAVVVAVWAAEAVLAGITPVEHAAVSVDPIGVVTIAIRISIRPLTGLIGEGITHVRPAIAVVVDATRDVLC